MFFLRLKPDRKGNVTLRKRVGIILEDLGIDEFLLCPLAKTVQKTAISSLGKSRKGPINKKWRVIVNVSLKEQLRFNLDTVLERINNAMGKVGAIQF